MGYKFLEDIAIADIAFEATGKDLNELFESAATALEVSMANIKKVKPKIKKEISLSKETVEELLFDFLNELVYLKDAESLLFSKFSVDVKGKKLHAEVFGDKIDSKTQELDNDVKAVTLHGFKVEKTKDGWNTKVILDV
ncbi:MAG: archease [Candidatus Aenigmarchaeota archaeon]|nr:archease [Candidatus Aenigmarchaeota archaeon]